MEDLAITKGNLGAEQLIALGLQGAPDCKYSVPIASSGFCAGALTGSIAEALPQVAPLYPSENKLRYAGVCQLLLRANDAGHASTLSEDAVMSKNTPLAVVALIDMAPAIGMEDFVSGAL